MLHFLKKSIDWAKAVFRNVSFGDARLKRRLIRYAADQVAQPSAPTNAVCEGIRSRSVGAYRLFRNQKVTAENILNSACLHTLNVSKSCETILAVEDTTDLSFSREVKVEGPKGKTIARTRKVMRKLYQHTSIALDAKNGDVLGLLHQHQWERDEKKTGGKDTESVKKRRSTPYDEKESFKWEFSSTAIQALFGEQSSKLISVCDREADVLDYLAYKRKNNQRFVVRATQNRTLVSEKGYLFDALPKLQRMGSSEVNIPQSGARKARTAQLTLRAGRLTLGRGKNYKKSDGIEVNVVWATEEHPPTGEKPLDWLLFTTESVAQNSDVMEVLRYYALRFVIEEYHKALKTGCKSEERLLKEDGRMDVLLAILVPIALRLLQLRDLAKRDPSLHASVLFDEIEIECLQNIETQRLDAPSFKKTTRKKGQPRRKRRTPKNKQTLRWALEQIAKFAGWQDTKRDGKIGWQKLWEGYVFFEKMVRLMKYHKKTE